MSLLNALRFPLRRPLRLASLALAQSLFLWLIIAAFDAAYRPYARSGNLEYIVILFLVFGSALFHTFWLRSSSVASLQRVIAGQNSLAPLNLSHFRPGGIGPAITSLVLMVYFVLFLALAAAPTQAPGIVSSLGFMSPDEALSLIASHVLVIGLGALVTLIFFVSLALYAAADAGLTIDARSARLFDPRGNLTATIRYLLRQFLLLGITAIAFNLGWQLVHAITPSGLGLTFVDPLATSWWVFAVFASCSVLQYFWHASLYLLADYVSETGATGAPK